MQPTAEEYIFVGYCENSKGYRVIHPVSKQFKKARDLTFFENFFSAKEPSFKNKMVNENLIWPFEDLIPDQQNVNNLTTSVEVEDIEENLDLITPDDTILKGQLCRLKKSTYGLKQANRN